MRRILALIALFALFPTAHALEVQSYESIIDLSGTTPQEEIQLFLINADELSVGEFGYSFGKEMVNLTVTDPEGELQFSKAIEDGRATITTFFRRPIGKDEVYAINYRFDSPQELSRREKTLILSASYQLFANVKNFKLTVILPMGHGVAKEGVSPQPTEITSDGRRISLEWSYPEPIPAELRGFKILVLFEKLLPEEASPAQPTSPPQQPVESPPADASQRLLVPALVAVLLVSLALNIAAMKGFSIRDYFAKGIGAEEKIEILKEDEQSIMKLIIEEDGIDQRDIQRVTGFSKTKVSKILSELEKRGAIVKQQIGRRNRIFLAEKLKGA